MSGWLHDQIVATYKAESLIARSKGGPGSGNWGHAGVKGTRGGSAPKSGMGSAMSLRTGKDWEERQFLAKQDAVLADMDAAAVNMYYAAKNKGYLPTKEHRLEALRVYQGIKKAHEKSVYTRANDIEGMAESLQYVTGYGSLKGAKSHFKTLAGSQDQATADSAQARLNRIEAIEGALSGKGPKKQPKRPMPTVGPPNKEVQKILDAPRTSKDFFIARPKYDKPGVSARVIGVEFEKVKAQPVKVPGYEHLDLFIHRPPGSKVDWVISDGRTGASVGARGGTKKAAIQNTADTFARMSTPYEQAMQRYIEGALQRNMPVLSPRYGGTG